MTPEAAPTTSTTATTDSMSYMQRSKGMIFTGHYCGLPWLGCRSEEEGSENDPSVRLACVLMAHRKLHHEIELWTDDQVGEGTRD